MNNVIINMGSNLGNRRLNLSRAMRRVGMEFGPFEMSHVVETPAMGYESEHKYLNICLMFATEDTPEEILFKLQKIESELSETPHRNADGTYADREIDIDVVAIDDVVVDSENLIIPHPRLAERRFFLEPLAEIAPSWKHPKNGKTAEDMLLDLN